MGRIEREKHIKTLEAMLEWMETANKVPSMDERINVVEYDLLGAVKYAISSLKTDLKYDLMYEGEEIYTKDDMVAMLTETQMEIDKIHIPKDVKTVDGSFAYCDALTKVDEVIQQKIEQLKE